MKILDTLTAQREVSIYIVDISLEEAMKNDPYVLYIDLPAKYEFLQVVQIEDALNGIMPLQGRTTLGYAFMVDPSVKETKRYYLTSLVSDVSFPWTSDEPKKRVDMSLNPNLEPRVVCEYLGMSTHNGVVVVHVATHVQPQFHEQFEQELREHGYRLVPSKKYDKNLALRALYQQYAGKAADGKVGEQVPHQGPGVGGARGAGDEPAAPAGEAKEG